MITELGVKDGGYIHHLILCKGWLWKRSSSSGVGASLQYRKRYFELSNINITYSQNEKKTGVSCSIVLAIHSGGGGRHATLSLEGAV